MFPCARYVTSLMMQEGPGSWWPLDAEVIMEDGRILATKTSTGHAVLVDCRFEFPAGEFSSRNVFLLVCRVIERICMN